MKNEYIPQLSTILEVVKHTDLEYSMRKVYSCSVCLMTSRMVEDWGMYSFFMLPPLPDG